jgi:hypothetical protein
MISFLVVNDPKSGKYEGQLLLPPTPSILCVIFMLSFALHFKLSDSCGTNFDGYKIALARNGGLSNAAPSSSVPLKYFVTKAAVPSNGANVFLVFEFKNTGTLSGCYHHRR